MANFLHKLYTNDEKGNQIRFKQQKNGDKSLNFCHRLSARHYNSTLW